MKLTPYSWVDYVNNATTESDAPTNAFVKDIFNLTLSSGTKKAPYDLTGTIENADSMLASFNMDLKSCDNSTETSQNQMTLVDRDWSNNAGWNWTYPAVEIQFDSQTANFTLNGYAAAIPYLINRVDPLSALGPDEVQGRIKVSFYGVIDPYYSDTLVNTSSTPTWLRTVGFGNNSVNIGYNSGSVALLRPIYWVVTIGTLLSLVLVYL
ncbi:hypothetical protein N7456_001324 [Penicillium angulare]|uniref:Uncharacterized protein n=1 Tax=Penicillium angulare TaxID=116970 RepID=A0A9W9GE68_9EURO|nr:hypothetical protein N7456_001324 [Penicillium angulare]